MVPDLAHLPPMDVAARAARLQAALADAGCDGVLVTNITNIRYLTGFSGSAALLLVTPAGLTFVTDGRYRDQSAAELAAVGVDAEVAIGRTADEQRTHLSAAASGLGTLGLEADDVTWGQQRRYADAWFDAELVPTAGLVESLRIVKDEGEVARLTAACAVADAALASVRPRLAEGVTEGDFAVDLDFEMRRLGAEDVSFETIVASGPNGAKPHHRAAGRRIGEGDMVVIDFGALVDGYHSDMTRTVMVGDPSPVQQRMYEVVVASQRAGVEAVKAGVSAREVDEACRAVIRDAGWEDAFLHGTGHGVGLDIHEAPRVSWSADATLADGHVVTVEPGVYLPEHGGVRIEDTVVVTPDGSRTLTLAPKDWGV